jgi:acetate kinase
VQFAVFDTAFHRSLPPAAFVYPGPYAWLEQGIRRYGFHGISHHYTAQRTATILGRDLESLRLISCHLGNGCSLAAIRDGLCVDTTMGFTPLDGLMMGTRSGSVDPGILLHLLRRGGCSVDQLDSMLNHESGLLGVSGISADMRQILAAMQDGNPRAQLAFDAYVHSVKSHIGALLPSLHGLDALVFTAGIGENCAPVRSGVCQGWEVLGLKLDTDKNVQVRVDGDISRSESAVRILVIRAQEEWAMATECFRLVTVS